MGYDPDALNESAETAEAPDGEATITAIEETTVGEVYADADFNPDNPNDPMIEVTANNGENEITDTFALPKSDKSWYNPNFKLGQFKERYGTVPREGMEVETSVNEETGFIEIDY